MGKDVSGGLVKAQLDKMVVSFVVLYEDGKASENNYKVFHVHHHATMTADRLKKSLYPGNPKAEKYFCYVFDEEVTLGQLDITSLVSEDGAPVFIRGEELLKFRSSSLNQLLP